MIRVEVNNGAFVEDYDIADVPTVADLIAKFQNDHGFRFSDTPVVYDASQNQALPAATEIVDGRIYAMTCWIIQKVDDQGNPVPRTF